MWFVIFVMVAIMAVMVAIKAVMVAIMAVMIIAVAARCCCNWSVPLLAAASRSPLLPRSPAVTIFARQRLNLLDSKVANECRENELIEKIHLTNVCNYILRGHSIMVQDVGTQWKSLHNQTAEEPMARINSDAGVKCFSSKLWSNSVIRFKQTDDATH